MDGYDASAGMTAFTADPNVNETDIPQFGKDDNLTGTVTSSNNVAFTVLEQSEKSLGVMRLLHGKKPSTNPLNDPKQYRSRNLEPVNLLSMQKDNDDNQIVKTRMWRGVQFNQALPEGAADDKSQRSFTGKGGTVREFDGLVTCDLIESGGGSVNALRSTPFAVPGETANTFAIHIEMLKYPGNDLASEDAKREPIEPVTPAMVNSAGVVDWPECVAGTNIDDPNRAHVYYLLSGIQGIPNTNATIEPEGMRGTL